MSCLSGAISSKLDARTRVVWALGNAATNFFVAAGISLVSIEGGAIYLAAFFIV